MLTDDQIVERLRSALEHETSGIDVTPGFVAGVRDQARNALVRRRTNYSIRAIVGVVSVAAAVAAVIIVASPGSPGPPPAVSVSVVVVPASYSVGPRLPVGAPAGPLTVDPNTFQGAAIPRTVKLAAMAPDPRGGLPWGLRTFQTTRGQTCLQVGRVQDGTIGVIGQDNAWGNDGRFHPISPNAYTADSCTGTGKNGMAFDNISARGAIASATVQWGDGPQALGCRIAGGGPANEPPCPTPDLRSIDYGLLGPNALSITYQTANNEMKALPTSGRDGAYLLVGLNSPTPCTILPNGGRSCVSANGRTSGPALSPGVIRSVTYTDGHVCSLPAATSRGIREGSCRPVGYRALDARRLSPGQVSAPISVRRVETRDRSILAEIGFTARVGVTSGDSYYQYSVSLGGKCRGEAKAGTTLANFRSGTRIVFQVPVPGECSIVEGAVSFVPTAGPYGFDGGPNPPAKRRGLLTVGRFR
jgi:hypothetical protein